MCFPSHADPTEPMIIKWFHGEAVTQGMFMTTVKLMFSLGCRLGAKPQPRAEQQMAGTAARQKKKRDRERAKECREERGNVAYHFRYFM